MSEQYNYAQHRGAEETDEEWAKRLRHHYLWATSNMSVRRQNHWDRLECEEIRFMAWCRTELRRLTGRVNPYRRLFHD